MISQNDCSFGKQSIEGVYSPGTSITSQTRKASWLATTLLKRGNPLLSRVVIMYRRLQALLLRQLRRSPSQKRWLIVHQARTALAGAALLLAFSRPDVTVANTIMVDGVICNLADAILAANMDTAVGGCTAGSRDDIISLEANILLTTAHGDYFKAYTGLPLINTTITIEGNGHTIERDAAAPPFRLLGVTGSGDLTLNEVTLRGGRVEYADGGAIYNDGYLSINYSTLSNNQAGGTIYGGGGAVVSRRELVISGSTLSGNQTYGSGGGVLSSGLLSVYNSVVHDNQTLDHNLGGGIYNSGTARITNSVVSDNRPDAIGHGQSYLTVTNSTVSGNMGNGLRIGSGKASIYNSTVSGNDGIGLSNSRGMVRIYNSTISHNHSGGIFNFDKLTVMNSTITGNGHADSMIGGLYNESASFCETSCFNPYGEAILARTIISGNHAREGQEIYNRTMYNGQVTADNYNIFGHSGNAGLVGVLPGDSDITPVEPLIKIIRTQLSDNGGPTLTHALPLGSPAIDRFSSLYCTLLPIEGLDQRGEPRNKDGDGTPSNQECDIGSFERQPPEFQLFLPLSAASTVFD